MPSDWVYRPVIVGLLAAIRLLGLRVSLEGESRIPTSGPVILASNHVSYLDFAFLGLAARHSHRYVRFLARHDVWHNRFAGPLMRGMRHIPVDREAPAAAYLMARSALADGMVVGIFPEAGVSKSYTVRPLLPGAMALARETGAPVVPVAMWGGQRIFTAQPALTGNMLQVRRGRPITIVVGEPYYADRETDVVTATRALGDRLQLLLDQAQAGHPDQPQPGVAAPWHPAHLGGTAPTPAQARLVEEIPRHAIRLG